MDPRDHWRPQGTERTDDPPPDVAEKMRIEHKTWLESAVRKYQEKVVRYEARVKELEKSAHAHITELEEQDERNKKLEKLYDATQVLLTGDPVRGLDAVGRTSWKELGAAYEACKRDDG